MKHKKRWIKALSILVLGVLLLLGLLHFPKLFIKKRFDYQSFHIYAHQDIVFSNTAQTTLDAVLKNLKESHFYKQDQTFHLFFIQGSFYEKLLRLFGRKNMAFAFWDNQVYSAEVDFSTQKLHRDNQEYETLNLIQIITHESVHNQMYAQHSSWGIPSTPSWINEGYCEYISYHPIRKNKTYRLNNLVDQLADNPEAVWIKTEYDTWTPRSYTFDRMIMEYLLDVKGMEVDNIIAKEDLDPSQIYLEVKKAF